MLCYEYDIFQKAVCSVSDKDSILPSANRSMKAGERVRPEPAGP